MYGLINLPKDELAVIIEKTSEAKNLSPAIIEKDLLVCVILDYLFTKSPWKDNLAFKGGTSLSKAFNLIERFSEDIDLILDWRVIGYENEAVIIGYENDYADESIWRSSATLLSPSAPLRRSALSGRRQQFCTTRNMAGMIYGERPNFDELIAEIAGIEQKINHGLL